MCGLKASSIYLRSSSSICSSDVYRQQSGWCRYLYSILTHFLAFNLSRFSFYINIELRKKLVRCYVWRACSQNGGGRNTFKILTSKPTGKRLLRPRHRWEDNIRMNLEEIGINAGNWVDSAQDWIIGGPL